MSYALGDTVRLIDTQSRYVIDRGEGEVVKVGRKYVTVRYGKYESEHLFDKNSGWEKTTYVASLRIRTDEQIVDDSRREELDQRLRQLGVEFRHRSLDALSAADLTAIAEIVERAKERTP